MMTRAIAFGAVCPGLTSSCVSCVQTDRLTFPHGAMVLVRCRELGVYKLLGESSLQCQNGVWTHRPPACIPTTMLTNFTEDSPPTVLIKIPSGSASVEPSGDLAVFPGSILHLECLFSRKLGNPEWTWTSTFRQFLTGWAIAAEEREWKYRLSIYYTKPQDSGVFTCSTPRGLTNSITVHVTERHLKPHERFFIPNYHFYRIDRQSGRKGGTAVAVRKGIPHIHVDLPPLVSVEATGVCIPIGNSEVLLAAVYKSPSKAWSDADITELLSFRPVHCEPMEINDPYLTSRVEGTRLGQVAVFQCPIGFRLNGTSNLTCQASGRWSAPVPYCMPIICPRLETEDPHLSLVEHNTSYGGRAVFRCAWGYRLTAPPGIECEVDGQWSGPVPSCEGVGGREIHRRMSVVYGEHSMSRSRVLAWHEGASTLLVLVLVRLAMLASNVDDMTSHEISKF
ncbi:hypothetical protein B7P43_G05854 [Cryptotermes secundus]|uniref:Locomotion-related protein Hikaru genki n=1 Tax=Cryptotermes secundus TaxID=105785 RepID=A0A2J7R631_9NEOP|nr:hypothetical protein B7P43_G05854 [Cryptotermes secundus]